jgi:FkbM family methyltransferase
MNEESQLIYDFGMNNGDDVEYYLKKGFRVVGVEANQKLCELATERFAQAIRRGDLIIKNIALAENDSDHEISFWIHRYEHVLSQLPRPSDKDLENFYEARVRQRSASSIVREHGPAHYIKVDLEHVDQVILKDLFENGIRPPFISAELHSIEVFCLLVLTGYKSFNIVDGPTVHEEYRKARIETVSGPEIFSFRKHSAGPFGEDVRSPWVDAEALISKLSVIGLGWKDLHATTLIPACNNASGTVLTLRRVLPLLGPLAYRSFKFHLNRVVPRFVGRSTDSV